MNEMIEKFVHDIRTPLASIQLGASGIKNYLPLILQNYENLLNGKQPQHAISQDNINLLLQVIENIETDVIRLQKMINDFMKEVRD